jgi:hypothetical protein
MRSDDLSAAEPAIQAAKRRGTWARLAREMGVRTWESMRMQPHAQRSAGEKGEGK